MKVCEIKIRFFCEDGKNHEKTFFTDGTSISTIDGKLSSKGWSGRNILRYTLEELVEDFLKNYKK